MRSAEGGVGGMARMASFALVLLLAGFLDLSQAKAAAWLSESGSKAWLSGMIGPEDDKKFEEFLNRPRAQKLKVIYLSSPGGYLRPAVAIGMMIRKAGMATAVEADKVLCDSACNVIFAGGAKRYYIRGDKVTEGFSSMTGLGYHPSSQVRDLRSPAVYSDKGTDAMLKYYRAMGQPRAAELAQKAAFNSIFRPNGKTALQLNIATSLSEPPD